MISLLQNENAPRITWMEGRPMFVVKVAYFLGFTAAQICLFDM